MRTPSAAIAANTPADGERTAAAAASAATTVTTANKPQPRRRASKTTVSDGASAKKKAPKIVNTSPSGAVDVSQPQLRPTGNL